MPEVEGTPNSETVYDLGTMIGRVPGSDYVLLRDPSSGIVRAVRPEMDHDSENASERRARDKERRKRLGPDGLVPLELRISAGIDASLQDFAAFYGIEIGPVILKALGLLKIARQASLDENRLAILNEDDEILYEIGGV